MQSGQNKAISRPELDYAYRLRITVEALVIDASVQKNHVIVGGSGGSAKWSSGEVRILASERLQVRV